MELFHFDIETTGEYKSFADFKAHDERGAKLFEGKWKRMGWEQKFSLEDSYLDQSGIMSTYGRICCISFARGIVERTVLRIERLDAPKGSIGEEESLRITRMSLFPSSGSLGAVARHGGCGAAGRRRIFPAIRGSVRK